VRASLEEDHVANNETPDADTAGLEGPAADDGQFLVLQQLLELDEAAVLAEVDRCQNADGDDDEEHEAKALKGAGYRTRLDPTAERGEKGGASGNHPLHFFADVLQTRKPGGLLRERHGVLAEPKNYWLISAADAPINKRYEHDFCI
jgi:hypothetical protein